MIEFFSKLTLKLIGVVVSVCPQNAHEPAEYVVRTVFQEEPAWAVIHSDQKRPLSVGDHVLANGEGMIVTKRGDIDGPFNPDDLYVELYNPEIHILRAT